MRLVRSNNQKRKKVILDWGVYIAQSAFLTYACDRFFYVWFGWNWFRIWFLLENPPRFWIIFRRSLNKHLQRVRRVRLNKPKENMFESFWQKSNINSTTKGFCLPCFLTRINRTKRCQLRVCLNIFFSKTGTPNGYKRHFSDFVSRRKTNGDISDGS